MNTIEGVCDWLGRKMEETTFLYKGMPPFFCDEYGRPLGIVCADKNGLICFECKKSYKNLGSHVFYAHDMTAREYKIKYSLNVSTPLMTLDLVKLHREVGKERYEMGEFKVRTAQQSKEASNKARVLRIGKPNSIQKRNSAPNGGTCGSPKRNDKRLAGQVINRMVKIIDTYGEYATCKEGRELYSGIMDNLEFAGLTWNEAKKMCGGIARPRGAQKGNQHGRKQGLFAKKNLIYSGTV